MAISVYVAHFPHVATAATAGFRTGEPFVRFHQMNTFFCCLVFQFRDETLPACVVDNAGQVVVFHPVCRFQRCHSHRLFFVNKRKPLVLPPKNRSVKLLRRMANQTLSPSGRIPANTGGECDG
jgi:hypothetical protein